MTNNFYSLRNESFHTLDLKFSTKYWKGCIPTMYINYRIPLCDTFEFSGYDFIIADFHTSRRDGHNEAHS